MKVYLPLVLMVSVAFFSSCALKVPEPVNASNGILAIPTKITNSTVSKGQFGYYFKILSSLNPDVAIVIYPEVGEKFIFSEELPPGEYYFDKIKNILDMQVASSETHSDVNTIPDIHVIIEAGSVTIADKRLVVDMKRSGPHSYQSRWGIESIPRSEMKTLIEKLQQLENSEKWRISNNK